MEKLTKKLIKGCIILVATLALASCDNAQDDMILVQENEMTGDEDGSVFDNILQTTVGTDVVEPKIDVEYWKDIAISDVNYHIDTEITQLTAAFLNEEGKLDRDSDDVIKARETVYRFACQLKENDIIKGAAYNEEGNTVSFFLKDEGTYVYVPMIEDSYAADDEYTIFSVDTLSWLSDTVISAFSGGNCESSAETIYEAVPEYVKWNKYTSEKTEVEDLRKMLGSLAEKAVRVIFWRGHGATYTESDGSIHYAFATSEEISAYGKSKYYNDLADNDGTSKTMCYFGKYFGINDNFFEAYTAEVEGGLFYTGSCCSDLAEKIMSKVLFEKGFDAYCGSNGEIFTIYSDKMMNATAKYLAERDEDGFYRTITDAFELAQQECGISDFGDNGVRMVLTENPEQDEEEAFRIVEPMISVVHEKFELQNGFIQPVEQLDKVPEGYVGIYSFDDIVRIADSFTDDDLRKYLPLNEFCTANYILMNDIICPDDYESVWVYAGVFDGNGYTIHNVSKPLFRMLSEATVKNLTVEINYQADITDDQILYGAIAGTCMSDSLIDNCRASGVIDLRIRQGIVGSLVGEGGDVINCYNATVIKVNSKYCSNVGGIVGSSASTTNCFNTGNIDVRIEYSGGTGAFIGGIVAFNGNADYCYNTGTICAVSADDLKVMIGGIYGGAHSYFGLREIEHCYNSGDISVVTDYPSEYAENCERREKEFSGPFGAGYFAGGIVGYPRENLFINECWNSGSIYGKTAAGGIGGYCPDNDGIKNCYNTGEIASKHYAGGIAGYVQSDKLISCCYNTGVITEGEYRGAIAASVVQGADTFEHCYFLDTGITATAVGISYSTAVQLSVEEMKDRASFEGFKIGSIWRLNEKDSTPQLYH